MKALCSLAAVLIALLCGHPAHAQARLIPVGDPAAFTETVARQTASQGMTPLRRTIEEFMGATELSPEIEAAFTTYERAIERRPPLHWAKLEDVSLSGQMRRIYYLHIFNEGTLLYTRFDFLYLGERGWALARLSFGSSWENVAGDFSPGWRPTP